MVQFPLSPESSAVLVIDMQNQFVGPEAVFPVPAGKEMIPRMHAFLLAVRRIGVPVIYTAYKARDGLPPHGPSAVLLPAVREGRAHRGPGAEIVQSLAPHPGDLIIDKPRQSAFYGTDLEVILRSLGADTVIISGVTTNVCCLATARDAAARDLSVVLLSDLTATSELPGRDGGTIDAETVHELTCAIVAHSIGEVTTSDDALNRFSGRSSERRRES